MQTTSDGSPGSTPPERPVATLAAPAPPQTLQPAQHLTGRRAARALAVLYTAGGTVALACSALPRPQEGLGVLRTMALAAVLLGVALATPRAARLGRGLHLAIGVIQIVIGTAYVAGGSPDGDTRLFFVWATPYAALFFSRRAAAAHMAWTGAVLAAALALMPAPTHPRAVAVGALTGATVLASGLLVASVAGALAAAEARARHESLHDPLTGLANRRQLTVALERAVGSPAPLAALVVLDLDHFKAVNDRYGHAEGDRVLQRVAALLQGAVRAGDLACRLGGDEFALLVQGRLAADEVMGLVHRVVGAVTGLGPDGGRTCLGASAGVRLLGLPGAEDVEAVLLDADHALYAAKDGGRGGAALWDAGLRADVHEAAALTEELRAALAGGDLRLVYQPVLELDTLRICGVEALARWRSPSRGEVGPDVFVRLAEEGGLVRDLTRFVLATACEQAARWPAAQAGHLVTLAVNVSAAQLGDHRVVDDVRHALARSGLVPSRLVLEVTETVELGDLASAQVTLEALTALGVSLALDDFGTGHSSLTHVLALPFHILKVDRTFVGAAARGDRRAVATVAAVGELAARLGVEVVAEGVEDRAHLPALALLGCSHAQGFALSRPLPPEQVASAVAAQAPKGWFLEPDRAAAGRAPVPAVSLA